MRYSNKKESFRAALARVSAVAEFRDYKVAKEEAVGRVYWSATPQKRHWGGLKGPDKSAQEWALQDSFLS